MKSFRKFLEVGGKFQLYIGVICMIVIVVINTIGIGMRKLLNSPLNWTEELSTFLFIWLAFSGASVAAIKKKHVSADFLTSKVSEKTDHVLKLIARVLMIVLLAFISVGAVQLQPLMMGHSSTALRIPKNIYYIPILLSSIYMCAVYIEELITLVSTHKSKKKA